MMKIALITDLHIGKEGEDTYGVDVRANFKQVLNALQQDSFDQLIIAGDLCFHEGERTIYEWIKRHLDDLSLPYHLVVGNHDDGGLMCTIFGIESDQNDQLYYKKIFGEWDILFLDSGERTISEKQLEWLKEQLIHSDREIMIVVHHPIVYANVQFMDAKHGLKNMEAIQKVLADDKRYIPVFSGHYHTEKTVCKNNIIQQITPSTFFQIKQSTPEFQVDHYRIAYRTIELDGEHWRSAVHYLEGQKMENGK